MTPHRETKPNKLCTTSLRVGLGFYVSPSPPPPVFLLRPYPPR